MWISLQHKTMEYAVTWDDRKAEKTDEIFKDREENTEKNTFSQYILLLEFSIYNLSLLKMWILLQQTIMEYESIEKENM